MRKVKFLKPFFIVKKENKSKVHVYAIGKNKVMPDPYITDLIDNTLAQTNQQLTKLGYNKLN